MEQSRLALVPIASMVFDTDPTSRYSIMHRLVESGAVCCRLDGRELTTFQQCLDPERPKPPDVHQVHGITDRAVQGQPTIEHVLPQFIESL
jgi:DNA polymerase III epsilon subunit-like protein